MDFKTGSLVSWLEEDKTRYGVVCPEVPMASVCAEWETPVHPITEKGFAVFEGMPTENLTLVEEIPVEYRLTDDHIQRVCLPGKSGPENCKFFVVGADGAMCAKGTAIDLIWSIEFGHTRAQGDNCLGKVGVNGKSEKK